MSKHIIWIVSACMGYFLGAYGLLYLINFDLPRWLENTLVIIATPLQLLCLPWIDLLSQWGLTEGQWVQAPSLPGLILVMVFYALLVGILAGFVIRLYKRILK